MNNNKQTLCTPGMGSASDQCADYLNSRYRKTISAVGAIVIAGLATTAFFLYHAVLNTTTLGGVPF